MANIFERFGILNASEVRLFDKSTDKLIVKILQGNSLSLEVKSDSKSAKEQGIEAISWSLGKTGTMKLSTETTSFAQLAEALGSNGLKLNTENETYNRTETATVEADGSVVITLSTEPLTGSVVSFNLLTRDGELMESLTGVVDVTDKKKFTITDTGLKIGNIVESYYDKDIATLSPDELSYGFSIMDYLSYSTMRTDFCLIKHNGCAIIMIAQPLFK